MKLANLMLCAAVAVAIQTVQGHVQAQDTIQNTRFTRGTGTNASYHSFVIPLDLQKGLACANSGGLAASLYPWNAPAGTLYHYNATNASSSTNLGLRIPFINPIAGFGSRAGGSPLYIGQSYRFGLYSGQVAPNQSVGIYLHTFLVTNSAYVNSAFVPLPNASNTNEWNTYLTNGYTRTVATNGLTTIVNFDQAYQQWGAGFLGNITLTHTASSAATSYVFQVELVGLTDKGYMVYDGTGQPAWCRMYTVEFEQRPPWRAVFIDQPHFAGEPLPPAYAGKTTEELLTNVAPVVTAISLPYAPATYTNLDHSPELRRHPILDRFVTDMRRDPVALTRYVFNEIELTDALDYNDNGSLLDVCINPAGVSRSALATFQEGQGSPTEQCALLVYLLRQAGVPAVYVYPTYNGMKMLDARLTQILRIQMQGAVNERGQTFTTNRVIPVNYPWVAAYVGTNWVHLFPWMKDTAIEEGFNVRDYMGASYPSGVKWMEDFLYGRTNIMSLASGDDTAGALFPKFLQQNLSQLAPGVSLDDIGVRWVDRKRTYARWQDFPTPLVTPTNGTSLDSLSSSAITNVFPALTNVFDTFSVEVTSRSNLSKTLKSGDLRLVDLHNRRFLIRHEKVGANTNRVIMSLAAYRPGATGPTNFTAGDSLMNAQQLSTNLISSDDILDVKLIYSRHRAAWGTGTNLHNSLVHIDGAYPLLYSAPGFIDTRTIRKGDLAAICINVGRVTRAMLNVQAQDLWNMERTLRADPGATNSLSPDLYQGGTAYLMGMAYFENTSRFNELNQRLHKVRTLSRYEHGLASISAKRVSGQLPNQGDVVLKQPNVDVSVYDSAIAFGGTIHPDANEDVFSTLASCHAIDIAHGSSEEHQILNTFFTQSDSISTVKLLQLAQSRSGGSLPGIRVLNYLNFVDMGNSNISGKLLKNYDPAIWSRVTNHLTRYDARANLVFMTPGAVTNSSNSYNGVGAFLWSAGGPVAALIGTNSLNGGVGPFMPDTTFTANNTPNYALGVDPSGNFYLTTTAPGSGNITLAPDMFAGYNAGSVANNATLNYYNYSGFQTAWTGDFMDMMGLSSQGSQSLNFAQSIQADEGNQGFLGWLSDALSQAGSRLADPVHAVTGEFYINTTDLALSGPMPLAVNRNYSSLNLADNQFGFGWKLDYMPYLSINAAATIIYAAEPDGAVLAYEKSATNANLYLPTTARNPQLNNNTSAGIGSTANRLRNRIEKQVNGSETYYFLTNPDGSKRTFRVMTFSGFVNQTRPCLTVWEDSRGNSFSFEYGTDSTQPDYGQARRVQSSNGNYFGFYFDVYGHITEAYAGDGRRLYYEYDQFGDLVKVSLPDGAEIQYEYEHKTQLVSGVQTPYSTHLILREMKPDGRVLKNEYDQHRRVTNQWSTVGADLNLVRNATFIYANNFNLTNSYTNTITGYTIVKDVFNSTNRYDYTNGLITKTTDVLNQAVIQDWYEPSETNKVGYYPRSLESRTDKRGLVTVFKYDSNGNATNIVITGDLLGDGTPQSATNTVAYGTNGLPTLTTDPVGNKVQTLYHAQYPFLPEYTVRLAGSTPVSTNKMVYGNVTNTFISGGLTYTNMALGVLLQEIRAFGSSDAATTQWTRDGRGFITATVRQTGTGDPAVTNTFFYSDRGELVEQTDALGRKTTLDYDGLSRPIAREVFEAGQGTPLAWEYSYYNPNGELTWSDGPRYDPEDYVWRDYDGAGRLITEIHWRSQARADGVGMEAPTGDGLFATAFRQYDAFGNLTRTTDPRGGITTNIWDKLGRLVQRRSLDFNGSTVLSSEGFAYEPGGLIRFHTNALGGVAETQYTTNGLPKFRLNADGSTNAWRYYLDGRVRREVQGNGGYWESTYDDANRKTTRVFYTAAGTALATNATVLDRRGNVLETIDAGFNSFTSLYDGLDRVKVAAGPPVVTTSYDPITGQTTTNILQQAVTNYYDLAGAAVTNVNALGERTITTSDALGRVTRVEVRNGANQLVRETDTAYTFDHHGSLVTQGSGSSAVETYHYTDNEGHGALDMVFSSEDRMEYNLRYYDLAGLIQNESHLTYDNGSFVSERARNFGHDALGRLTVRVDRDDAYTYFYPDAMGNVTNRVMPGGLQWRATYNNAGQMTKEWNVGGSSGTRTNTYSYFASGSPFAGLLQSRTDNRGVTSTITYDSWLRPATNSHSGSLPEQNLTTAWQYDARGLATNITEQFGSSSTGPSTAVQRNFDAYGQIASETVAVGGSVFSSAPQGFDAAGRRTILGMGNGYSFGWRGDGLLATVSLSRFDSASYSYTTGGLLTSRTTGGRATTVSSRDGAGRPLSITTSVNAVTKLTESLTWTGDGLLSTHTLNRTGDFNDSREYLYGNLNRRLTEERLNLDSSRRWTNVYTFDNGSGSGPGVLTRIGQTATSSTWSGVKDAFSRVGTETNTYARQTAYGKLNGLANVSLSLDNVPVSFSVVGTTNQQWPYQWRATLELQSGTHRLDAKAVHTSGLFTTNATSWFTNNLGALSVTNIHDGNGNLTQRIWRKANGTTNLIQTLAWDGRGRLFKVTERDSTQSGRDFTVTYDAFGRRLRTTEIAVTNNVALTNSPLLVDHYFDPQVEFLELGLTEGGKTTWKLMGSDLDGRYGGQNGTGGFEAAASGMTLTPLIADAFGNVVATISGGSVSWSSNRVSAYGAVPGYKAPSIGIGNVGLEYSWRNRAADSFGFVWMGGNWLDPVSGRFISFDPLGHDASDSGYSFCGGNPVGYVWDPDGRLGKQGANFAYNGGLAGYGLRELGGYLDNYQTDNAAVGAGLGYYGSLVNSLAGMSAPSTYVNGLNSFGNSVSTIYREDGLVTAGSYAATSWNVGAIWSGAANIDMATGQQVGDWYQRGTVISSGVANTAGIAAAGLGGWAALTEGPKPPVIETGAYDPAYGGGGQGLGSLAGKEIRVSQRGLDLVENHLSQFGDVAENTMMLDRLRSAMTAGERVAGANASFYLHEASEATMMGRGLTYDAAHAGALAKYGVSPFSVYHPEVITALPGSFNQNWMNFWGIKPKP